MEGIQHLLHNSKLFPLTSYGRLNLAPLFAELGRNAISKNLCGFILPSGIATDSFNQYFFADTVESGALVSLYDIENRQKFFPEVDSRYKFSLLTMAGTKSKFRNKNPMNFAFFLTDISHLRDERRVFSLTTEDFTQLNPNTKTCPVFRTRIDAEITKAIYRRIPVFADETIGNKSNSWGFRCLLMFMMNTDSKFFKKSPDQDLLPLYEGKMVQAYNHRSASVITRSDNLKRPGQPQETELDEYKNPYFSVKPQYWVPAVEVYKRLQDKWPNNYLITWKKVTSPTNERTLITGILPLVGVSDSMYLFVLNQIKLGFVACLYASMNAIVLDYIVRQKIGGVNLNAFYIQQLPVLPPSAYSESDLLFIVPRVLELVYTAFDIKPFADDLWGE